MTASTSSLMADYCHKVRATGLFDPEMDPKDVGGYVSRILCSFSSYFSSSSTTVIATV